MANWGWRASGNFEGDGAHLFVDEAVGGENERGGAVAANDVRALGEVAVILKIEAGFAIARGKSGAEQAGGKCGDFGDADFLAVEGGAFAAGSGEEFVVDGIEDHGDEQRVALGERDGNAEAGV